MGLKNSYDSACGDHAVLLVTPDATGNTWVFEDVYPMKRFFVFAVMLGVLSVPVFAAKNSQTVDIPSTMKAGSTTLAAGSYNVSWDGAGPDVQVTFAKNKKVIVTLPGKVVEQSNKNGGFDIGSEGGVDVLQAIRMKNMTLQLEGSAAGK